MNGPEPRAIGVVANLDSQNCLHSLLVDLVEDEKVYFHSLTVNRLERAPIRVALHDLSHTPDHHRPIENCAKRSNISSVRPSPNASAPHRSAFDLSHRRRRPRRPRTRSRGAIARTFSSSRRLASSFSALARASRSTRGMPTRVSSWSSGSLRPGVIGPSRSSGPSSFSRR